MNPPILPTYRPPGREMSEKSWFNLLNNKSWRFNFLPMNETRQDLQEVAQRRKHEKH